MKKIISLLIVTALLLSMLSVTAFAAGDEKPAPQPTVGPAESVSLYGGARLGIYDTHSYMNRYVVNFDYQQNKLAINNDAVPGMTYDKASNTLTIKDIHQRDNQLFIWYMGNDFKLNVKGENEFGVIFVYDYFGFHSTSLNIIGDGTLTVNEQKNNDVAIKMFSDGDAPVMGLDIADSVNVNLYSEAGEDGEDPNPVVGLSETLIAPEKGGAITVGGKTAPEAQHKQIVVDESDTVPVIEIYDRDTDYPHGKRLKSKSDPGGVYVLSDIMDDVVYMVSRYMYVNDLRMWVVDHSFSDGEFYGKRYTKDEFEQEYDYVYGVAPTQLDYMEEYRLHMRGENGVKIVKDGEPDVVYIGLPAGAMWDEDYSGMYQIYRVIWDDKQEIYLEDTAFEPVNLWLSEMEEQGYHVVKETKDEPLELTVWTSDDSSDTSRFEITNPVLNRKSDPDGLYIQVGTYSGSDDESGISIHKVHYNPETEEHYILYNSYSSSEYFLASDADLESGESDFSYATETLTKHVFERFLTKNYNVKRDLVSAIQLQKEDEPDAIYAYKEWTHYSQGVDQKKYAIIKLQYNEDIGCYVEDSSFEEYEIYDPSYAEYIGYKIVKSNQPIDFTTKGNIDLAEYPVYTSADGKKYFVDFGNNIFDYSKDNTVTLGEITYYIGTPNEDVSLADLNDTVHQVVKDTYGYWIPGTEYHHVAGVQPEPVAYDLWVNGEQVTSDHLTVTCGTGTAVYDPAKNTLTLNNAEITQGTNKDQTYSGVLSQMDQLTVVIKGDCTITETDGDGIGTYNSESYQIGDVIYPAPYDLTITGDGTLTIKESTALYGYGLYCTGNLQIQGVTLNINSAAAGVWASDLKMNGVKADIHTSSWYSGIVINRGNFSFVDSTVSAESKEGAALLLGNDKDKAVLTMDSGKLNLKGKLGAQGVADTSVITVNGGKLTLDGTEAAFDATYLADNAKNIVMGEGIGVIEGAVDGTHCVIAENTAPSGYIVSGKLTSYLDDEEYVRITLLNSEENWQINCTVQSSNDTYRIDDVPAGTYKMTVEKKDHVTREYDVTVSGDTTQDVKIHPLGDINGDGKVNAKDLAMANAHVQKVTLQQGYALKCGDVVKGDGKILAADVARINSHIQKVNALW